MPVDMALRSPPGQCHSLSSRQGLRPECSSTGAEQRPCGWTLPLGEGTSERLHSGWAAPGLPLGPAGPSGHTPGQPSLMAQVVCRAGAGVRRHGVPAQAGCCPRECKPQ